MNKVEVSGDTIHYRQWIVARISPSVPLAIVREFEEFLDQRPDRDKANAEDQVAEAKIRLLQRHEIQHEIIEQLKEAHPNNGGLFTVDEIEEVITDYLETAD